MSDRAMASAAPAGGGESGTGEGGGGRRGTGLWASLSLERRLPLLMTGILAVVLATSLVLTHDTLNSSAEARMRQRLERALREVAGTAIASTIQRRAMLQQATQDPAVRAVLERPADSARLDAARRALGNLMLTATDSLFPAEIWTADGRRVVHLGPDLRTTVRESPAVEQPAHPLPHEEFGEADGRDSVRFLPLYQAGDLIHYWAIAPVVAGGRRIGYVTQQRRVAGPPTVPRMLRALTGEDVTLYTRNADGEFWVTSPGTRVAPPLNRDTTADGVFDVRPRIGRTIVAESALPGTPWVMVLEASVSAARARSRPTMLRLTGLSVLLIGIGGVLSWAIGRRIARPLASLTTAAEAISRGDYARRVDHAGGDEVGRLAASFNQMAGEVAATRTELERRVEEAQSAALEAELANQQLHDAMLEAESAREDADKANRAKSDFLAVMSHELRTPLNAIGGYAQLLELGVHGPVTEAQRDALSRIARSQAHLLRLTNDVLNFAKIDAGRVRYEITDVSLDEVLAELEALVSPQMLAKQLQFVVRPCNPPLIARADREKLQQIVLNLLSNAIKFTPDGGRVTVECSADVERVYVRVRDTGVGIPPERLTSIFDPFVQGDRALHRPNDGVGLGLAISRDLARGMGGDISVASANGEGSTFTLTLARPDADDDARAAHSGAVGATR